MRARSRLILTLLGLLAPAGGAVLAQSSKDPAASQSAEATAAQLSSQATPLFTVAPAPACHEALCFWADSRSPGASLTLSRTHMLMINPEIVDTTRGIAHITADRGEENGPEVGNSRWVFTGHIRADMSGGQLRADKATVRIVDGRIVSIDAQGGPALFQRAAGTASPAGNAAAGAPTKGSFADVTVRGHADSITYDAMHEQVQFSGNSWFTDGCNELTSQLVTYDMQTQTVQAGAAPGSSGRVQGVVRNTRPGSSSSSSNGSGSCTADSGHS